MVCQNCGTQNREGACFCKRCGKPLSGAAPTRPCPACGRQVRQDAGFCKYCGARFGAPTPQGKARDPWLGLRVALALLCAAMLVYGALTIPGKLQALGEAETTQAAARGEQGPDSGHNWYFDEGEGWIEMTESEVETP